MTDQNVIFVMMPGMAQDPFYDITSKVRDAIQEHGGDLGYHFFFVNTRFEALNKSELERTLSVALDELKKIQTPMEWVKDKLGIQSSNQKVIK